MKILSCANSEVELLPTIFKYKSYSDSGTMNGGTKHSASSLVTIATLNEADIKYVYNMSMIETMIYCQNNNSLQSFHCFLKHIFWSFTPAQFGLDLFVVILY